MENMKTIKIKLTGIIGCIMEYTSDPSMSTIINSLTDALKNNDFDVILFTCKEINSWYKNNISKILSNNWASYKDTHKKNLTEIQQIVSDLESNQDKYKQESTPSKPSTKGLHTETALINILNKFHKVVIQLRDRYNDRETLDIDDEYDVQDLLHSLLQLYFDDIRREEWTPSYAGTSSRQDFLLKNEKIIIETKKTRKNLGNKELADELIIDISRYSTHPDCKKLVCFVYDPENRVKNPRGFENDLMSNSSDKLEIVVCIRP